MNFQEKSEKELKLEEFSINMFTGIVKLAQIDDYISPAQNCIQPKIMKKTEEETKATVTLNDCLACSGCITSAESVLVEQMSLEKFKSILKDEKQAYLILSPQSLISLSVCYSMEPQELFVKISEFFTSHFPAIKNVFFEAEGIKLCHELILKEFLEAYTTKKQIICSECPGWVCYAEKTLTEEVTNLMSKVKSPQQIMARLIKEKYGKECKVISIMPCFDKKLEAIRFNFEENSKEVDITLATNEIQSLLKEFPENYLKNIVVSEKMELEERGIFLGEDLASSLRFLEDQTSNGYISMILRRLNASNIEEKVIKNSDFIEVVCVIDGQIVKMAKCYGFRNIQKVVSLIKRKKCEYAYIEIMACPSGCYGGGGQIRYEEKKPKDLVVQFKELEKPFIEDYSLISIPEEILSKLHHKDFTVNYKPIEKSFTSTVMNW